MNQTKHKTKKQNMGPLPINKYHRQQIKNCIENLTKLNSNQKQQENVKHEFNE